MTDVDAGQRRSDGTPQTGGLSGSAGDYFQLSGKVALVTGASSGLGRRFARVLASAGATVGIAARRYERLQDLAREIAAQGGAAIPIEMDVTEANSVEAGFSALENALGPAQLLVNNAGIALTRRFLETSDDDLAGVFETNVLAKWRVARRAAQAMVQAGTGGAIVNVASILGIGVARGLAAYAASKAAIIQMTKAMALELSKNAIRVNAIAPGYIETDLNRDYLTSDAGKAMAAKIPMRRIGREEDLDAALLLLLSERGSYITGSVISVDGGHLLSGL
jgi:NAD(P)-dependent dehydrogenase (short-subunit alcohol dehydrogenase family)